MSSFPELSNFQEFNNQTIIVECQYIVQLTVGVFISEVTKKELLKFFKLTCLLITDDK